MDTKFAFVNGEFVPEEDASLSIFDHAVLYGDGAFDTALAWNGYIFRLEAHLDRLFSNLHAIKLTPGLSRDEIRQALIETVRRNNLREAYIKCVVTRGVSPEPLLDPRPCIPGVIIFARPYLSLASSEQQAKGLRAKVTTLRRVGHQALPAQIKSLNYLNLILAKIEAVEAGFDEALMMDEEGFICEAPGYNIFVVAGETVITPGHSILLGITRAAVLDLCNELELRTEIKNLTLFDVYTADEVFLSSTAGGLVPVVNVDGREIGEGKPGQIWENLNSEYWKRLSDGWDGTPIFSDG